MAKPILVVGLNLKDLDKTGTEINKIIKEGTEYEYHIMIYNSEEFKVECFNDCKGLKDIDIEQLIKEYTNGKE